jgi:hypothetical protein
MSETRTYYFHFIQQPPRDLQRSQKCPILENVYINATYLEVTSLYKYTKAVRNHQMNLSAGNLKKHVSENS